MTMTKTDKKAAFTVNVEEHYWLSEHSESRLRQLGATCVEEVTTMVDYYDDETFQLASQQIWLSRHNGQWRLILGRGPSLNVASKTAPAGPAASCEERKSIETSPNASAVPHEKDQDPKLLDVLYCELTGHQEIIEQLARRLHIALTTQEAKVMAPEGFLQMAGIQRYGSHQSQRRATYKLQDCCTVVIQDEESSDRRAAVVTMEADVLNIVSELERLEEIATQLELLPVGGELEM
ncbi:uncharacterized protein si:dkey-191c17.2 [Erpetoichthys calabaricus]|uniref:uncharacterized protein si:dkey-191c17.2 n=1 Tax=Erpetoichthys calabaricus TaxID=27687 RepID=UPI00109EF75B|nr:uncharacterized protein si:dkey-191c17.2 [Erpetoichthys calabaricus]